MPASNTVLKGKRVFVGLSGGVDSAVTAALLQRQGARVAGVFIKGWYPPGMPCSWAADRRDAMRVAAALGIPFATLDASSEYKKGVIEYLLAEYAAGRTPNPDIMCNREVKFGAFVRFAKEHGADLIATGHYAAVERDPQGSAHLYRGTDANKDQSYFLWAIPASALSLAIFPLGSYEKRNVRSLAKRFKLPVAEKRDSQGICFLGSVSVDDWLRSEFGTHEGVAVDEEGGKIGTHDGVLLYTLGGRVALKDAPPGPWFVIRKDIGGNSLVVSKRHVSKRLSARIELAQMNLFRTPGADEALQAQYRYHGPLVSGRLDGSGFVPAAALYEPIAPGQSLALYSGEECIGGGIIAQ